MATDVTVLKGPMVPTANTTSTSAPRILASTAIASTKSTASIVNVDLDTKESTAKKRSMSA